MFFIFSKILDFLVSPLNWIIILFALGLFLKKWPLAKKRCLTGALVCLLFFSNPFIFNQCMYRYEPKGITYSGIKKQYDVGIVLGGFMSYYNSELKTLSFGEAVDRLTEGLMLYRKGKIKKILISGGSGFIVKDDRESKLAKDFLVEYCNIPAEDVMIETESKNTRQNALESAKILNETPYRDLLLITSAYHMPRALGCFKKAGLNVTPYCVDQYSGAQQYYPNYLIVPDPEVLNKWDVLIHEWLGLAVYKSAGYI